MNETKNNEKIILKGKILNGIGGRYSVLAEDGQVYSCKARGNFRHNNISPYPGDNVCIESSGMDTVICEILPRKNFLKRPPAANIDLLFVTVSADSPSPSYITIDKLILAAEYYHADIVIVVTKAELNTKKASEIQTTYEKCGFKVFVTSCKQNNGISELKSYIFNDCEGLCAVFAGESGVGKSSLLNALFSELNLQIGEVSNKIGRGKHTTRAVSLFPLHDGRHSAFLADTPGFGIFDVNTIVELIAKDVFLLFREFFPHYKGCKFKKCTHLCEDGCAIISATQNGIIPVSRFESFITIYNELKDKRLWQIKEK